MDRAEAAGRTNGPSRSLAWAESNSHLRRLIGHEEEFSGWARRYCSPCERYLHQPGSWRSLRSGGENWPAPSDPARALGRAGSRATLAQRGRRTDTHHRVLDASWLVSIGNLLLLMPLAVYLPVLIARARRAAVTVFIGMGVSLAIELAQSAISAVLGFTYKIADVDDVITNPAGVSLGYAIFSVMSHWQPGLIARLAPTHQAK